MGGVATGLTFLDCLASSSTGKCFLDFCVAGEYHLGVAACRGNTTSGRIVHMRRLSIGVIAGLLLVGLIVAPASAKQPLWGDLDHENVGCETPDERWITFAGPIVFDDDIYGMAFFSAGPAKFVGMAYHFAEYWEIYAEPFDTAGCTPPSEVVASGYDWGVVNVSNLKGVANGQVEVVNPDFDPHERFTDSLEGRNVHWKGLNSPDFSEFDATFRINN